MQTLQFVLNGVPVEASGLSPTTTLLRYVRDREGLTGTKEGCAEGDCGACTVAVLEHDAKGRPRWRAQNACLLLLPMVQGKQVVTVDGLADAEGLHPAQKALAEATGSQCGYCTPGVVMALFEATYREDLDEPWKLDAQMCGNLCRCTGYRPIRDAAGAIAGTCPKDRHAEALQAAKPAEIGLSYSAGTQQYFTPTSLEVLWELLAAHPEARFVNGGTDLSLEVTKRFETPPLLISLEGLSELGELKVSADGALSIGASVRLADLEDASRRVSPALERMLRYFGARQIKNRGTVGGNLCNASPIGDLPPILIALGAEAVLLSRKGSRTLPLEDFFLDYRKTALEPGEILARIEVPATPANARTNSYKLSKRRELDISAVAAGMRVVLDEEGVVQQARLAFGGMAATPKRAAKTEAALVGQPWTEATVEAAAPLLAQDFKPLSDHRGSSWYRSTVVQNLLLAFFEETSGQPSPRLVERHTATAQVR